MEIKPGEQYQPPPDLARARALAAVYALLLRASLGRRTRQVDHNSGVNSKQEYVRDDRRDDDDLG